MRVPESSVYVHRVVRPRSGTKYSRLVMGVVVVVRVVRGAIVWESTAVTLLLTFQHVHES